MRLENVSEENLDDLFEICSGYRAFAPRDDPTLEKGREIKRRLLLDMLDRHGPCAKIAYLDGRPRPRYFSTPRRRCPTSTTRGKTWSTCNAYTAPSRAHREGGPEPP